MAGTLGAHEVSEARRVQNVPEYVMRRRGIVIMNFLNQDMLRARTHNNVLRWRKDVAWMKQLSMAQR